MRVVLLPGESWLPVRELARHLPAGVAPRLLQPGGLEALERRLTRRGYERGLTRLPASRLELWATGADLVHAFAAPEAALAARWSRRTGRPSVFSLPEVPTKRWLTRRRGRLARVLEASAGTVATLTTSEFAARELEWSLGLASRVLEPGVDVHRFTPRSTDRAPAPSLLCPGRWPAGGFTAALPAAPGMEGLQVIHAASPSVDMYRHAWVTVPDPLAEAYPMAALASLACGTPVVLPEPGPGREILGQGTEVGALFEAGSPEALARAVLEALDMASGPDAAERCRARAQHFSLERYAAEHAELYHQLAA